jgi:hypothetical protein
MMTDSFPWYEENAVYDATPIKSGRLHALYLKAIRLANTSKHWQPMAAFALKGSAVVNQATNGEKFGLHAEWRALRGKGEADTIMVARHNAGMSRPCRGCLDFLRERGVDRMIYGNRDGVLVSERLYLL